MFLSIAVIPIYWHEQREGTPKLFSARGVPVGSHNTCEDYFKKAMEPVEQCLKDEIFG